MYNWYNREFFVVGHIIREVCTTSFLLQDMPSQSYHSHTSRTYDMIHLLCAKETAVVVDVVTVAAVFIDSPT